MLPRTLVAKSSAQNHQHKDHQRRKTDPAQTESMADTARCPNFPESCIISRSIPIVADFTGCRAVRHSAKLSVQNKGELVTFLRNEVAQVVADYGLKSNGHTNFSFATSVQLQCAKKPLVIHFTSKSTRSVQTLEQLLRKGITLTPSGIVCGAALVSMLVVTFIDFYRFSSGSLVLNMGVKHLRTPTTLVGALEESRRIEENSTGRDVDLYKSMNCAKRDASLQSTLRDACEAACSIDEKEAADGRQRIQASFDRVYPGVFRVCIFSWFWQTPVFIGNAPKSLFNLVVFQNDNSSYSAIDGVSRLFRRPYYCFECCKTYSNQIDHTMHCPQKCTKCTRIGRTFPCTPGADAALSICCTGCNKVFENRVCYEKHHLKGVCDNFKKCPICRRAYNTRGLKRYTANGLHVCGHELCFYCFHYHLSSYDCFTSNDYEDICP